MIRFMKDRLCFVCLVGSGYLQDGRVHKIILSIYTMVVYIIRYCIYTNGVFVYLHVKQSPYLGGAVMS